MTTVAFMSDLHIDSNNFGKEELETLITLFKDKKIQHLHIAGDIANGFEKTSQEFLDQLQCHLPVTFSLGNHDENILKYIECIFGSNEAYLYGQLKKTDSKSRVISVIEHLYDKSNNPKLKTIYVDIEYVRLIDENLECIILPERLLAFEEFKSFSKYSDSKYSGVTIIEYKTNPTHHPAWYNGVVSDLLEGYLREKGKV